MVLFKHNLYNNTFAKIQRVSRKVLVDDVEIRLKEIIKDVCNDLQADLIEIECDKDHVHLLVEVDPQFGIHRLVKRMKSVSSRILRQEFHSLKTRLPTLWTNSYFCATTGGTPIEQIKAYIQNQKVSNRG
ncbi:MAG: IS200/IS605 family transposase [Ghiorsea sp.]|nr:IS200/IS605 family transposase [Ghiorsea sp.]